MKKIKWIDTPVKKRTAFVIVGLWVAMLVFFGAYGVFSADYAANQQITGLEDVSGVLTDAALVPVQKIGELGKIGSASTEDFRDVVFDLDGNITFVGIGDDIETAVTAAAAGDSLILAAGTYTITDDIDIGKSICITGQGKGRTIILTVTDSKNCFHVLKSNVTIQDLTIDITASTSKGIYVDGTAEAALTGVFINNVDIVANSHNGIQTGIHFEDAGGTHDVRDCVITLTSADTHIYGVHAENAATDDAISYVNCHNVSVSGTNAGRGYGFRAEDSTADFDVFLNLYNCASYVTGGTDYAVQAAAGDAYLYAENCVFEGDNYDVYNNAAGGIRLRDCTLVNNLTSGTITEDGTVITDNLWVGDNITLDSDSAKIELGDNQEVTITHVHDVGYNVKHTATGDNKPVKVVYQTGEEEIVADEVLGGIYWQAPDEDTGTDAQLVAAGIEAVAEDTFDATTNETKLSFKTGASETATEKMTLSSGGNLGVTGNVDIGSGGDAADTGTINLKNGDVIAWEDAAEATITHVNDTGWDFKAGLTTDDQPIKFVLKTSETDMAADDVLGGIYFQAPDEAATGDAQLVAAGIEAVSEGDFSAISNATELSFKTGASEIATSKMTLSSAGVLTLSAGGIVIPDTGNIGSATDTNAIAIDGSGGVACTATTAATGITAAALETAGGLGVTYDIWVGDDIVLDSDSAVIQLGADQDVKITHVADVGFNVKETGTGAGTPVKIVMQNGELDIAGGDVIGGIYFQAPDEGTETDSQLVCAGIEAVSEGNFAADNNATKLSFQTGASETAAEKMALSSAGVLTTTSDVELGHATDTTIARSAAGAVTIEGKQIVLTGVAAGREFSVHNESHGEAQEDITEAQILASKFFTNQGSAGETDSRLPAVSYYISITLIVNEAQIWEIEPPDTEAFDLNGTVLAADDVIDSPTGIGAKIVLTRMLLADGTTWRWSADTVRGVWVDGDAED